LFGACSVRETLIMSWPISRRQLSPDPLFRSDRPLRHHVSAPQWARKCGFWPEKANCNLSYSGAIRRMTDYGTEPATIAQRRSSYDVASHDRNRWRKTRAPSYAGMWR